MYRHVYTLWYNTSRKVIPMSMTIKKWGNSQGIIIPKKILKDLNLSVGEAIDLEVFNNQIILKKKHEINTIYDLFQNYDGGYFKADLVDFKEDMGREVIED